MPLKPEKLLKSTPSVPREEGRGWGCRRTNQRCSIWSENNNVAPKLLDPPNDLLWLWLLLLHALNRCERQSWWIVGVLKRWGLCDPSFAK